MERPHLVDMVKEDQKMPDAYGLEIEFKNGKQSVHEIVSHSIHNKEWLEFITAKSEIKWVSLDVVAGLSFDSRLNTIIELKREQKAKEPA